MANPAKVSKGNDTAARSAAKQPKRFMIKVGYRTEDGKLKWRMEEDATKGKG